MSNDRSNLVFSLSLKLRFLFLSSVHMIFLKKNIKNSRARYRIFPSRRFFFPVTMNIQKNVYLIETDLALLYLLLSAIT